MAAPIEQEDYVSSPTDKTDVQSSAEDEFLNEVNATFPLILLQCSDCSRVCHNTVVYVFYPNSDTNRATELIVATSTVPVACCRGWPTNRTRLVPVVAAGSTTIKSSTRLTGTGSLRPFVREMKWLKWRTRRRWTSRRWPL